MNNIEEQLAEITADLVEREENSPFLERLFARKAGTWEDATVLCDDLGGIKTQIEQLQQQFTDTLQVTWLAYPHSAYGKGYCVIIFFAADLPWSRAAIYNKQWFLQKLAQRQSVVE